MIKMAILLFILSGLSLLIPVFVVVDLFYRNSIGNYHRSMTDKLYGSSVKLTFDEFASFFAINPNRYIIDDDWYVTMYVNDEMETKMVPLERTRNGEKYLEMVPCNTGVVFRGKQRIYFSNYFEARKYNRFRRLVKAELERRKEAEKTCETVAQFAKVVQRDIDHIKNLAGEEREHALDAMMQQLETMKGV